MVNRTDQGTIMSDTETDLPVLGVALTLMGIDEMLDWIRDSDRDLELQDFVFAKVLDGDWRGIADRYRTLLDGHGGRIGMHGPFFGFDMAVNDPEVQAVAQKRFLQGLEAAEAVGATQMVVHSPFTFWHHRNFGHQLWLVDQILEACHTNMAPVVKRAEEIGCELVIENIQDVDPLERVRLADSFNSDAVRVSLDTGHAHLTGSMAGAPPVDYYVKAAGKRLHHVHIQDTDGHADRHWLPGDGTIAWPAFFEAIAEHTDKARLIIEVTPARVPGVPDCVRRLQERGLAR